MATTMTGRETLHREFAGGHADSRIAESRQLEAKLQKLQQKVRMHKPLGDSLHTAQPRMSPTASTKPSNTMQSSYSVPAIRNNCADNSQSFMTPSDGFESEYAPAAQGMDDPIFLRANELNATFCPAESLYVWTVPHDGNQSKGPSPPVTPSSATGVGIGSESANSFSLPQSPQDSNRGEDAQRQFTEFAAPTSQKNTQWKVDAAAPAQDQDRILCIMRQVKALGFESFDEVIEEYYTGSFENNSLLSQDQRMSRNRRLPRLMSTLYNSSRRWSDWERRGFQEQITLNAEEILLEELNSYISQRHLDSTTERLVNNNSAQGQFESRTSRTDKQNLQENLPNLWALTTALSTRSNAFEQDTRSDIVLEVIEKLCSGRRSAF